MLSSIHFSKWNYCNCNMSFVSIYLIFYTQVTKMQNRHKWYYFQNEQNNYQSKTTLWWHHCTQNILLSWSWSIAILIVTKITSFATPRTKKDVILHGSPCLLSSWQRNQTYQHIAELIDCLLSMKAFWTVSWKLNIRF